MPRRRHFADLDVERRGSAPGAGGGISSGGGRGGGFGGGGGSGRGDRARGWARGRQARRGREEAKKALDEKLRERDMLNKQARCAEIGEIRRD